MKKDQGMARRTMDSYKSGLKNYFLPILGTIKLERINEESARKFFRLAEEKKLGVRRKNGYLVQLKQMLNDGVKLNYLVKNPLSAMKKIKEPPRSLTYWMPHEIGRFLENNKHDSLYPLYIVALNTGLRRGELLGLCWDKVNLKERRIEISRIRDRYELKNTTKTGMIRYVPLNDSALKVLKKLSDNKSHDRYVFTEKDGGLIDVTHIGRIFKKAFERADVPKIRFHDLRTTYASNFVMAGGDIFALSKLLGHTSVEMTAKKYAALHPNFMKDVVQTVQFG